MQKPSTCRLLSATIFLAVPFLVFGQSYPNKPIRVVTNEVGGGNDFAMRLMEPGLSAILGQRVIIDNRSNLDIAVDIAGRSPPDGYTLIFFGTPFWLAKFLRKSVSWDPVNDFSSVSLAAGAPNVLIVHPSLQIKSVKELIALAKAKPEALSYAAGSIGSTPHLAAELFKSMAGVKMLHVNYKGGGASVNGMIAGEVQTGFPSAGSVAGHIKAGRLKAIAVTSAQPSVLFPELPTVAASGLPGYESSSPFGLFAPRRVPDAVINRVSLAVVQVLNQEAVKERFLGAGVEPIGGTPQQLLATVKAEMAKWGKVIKDAGIAQQD